MEATGPGEEVINLNPGTLGTPSAAVRMAQDQFRRDTLGYPLGYYLGARMAKRGCRDIASSLWPFEGHLALVGSTSSTMASLCLALPQALTGPGPIKVWTSHHEHPGGIGGFERSSQFEVHYLPLSTWREPATLLAELSVHTPDVVFLSHMTWTEAAVLPLVQIFQTIRHQVPNCWRIADVAQSLGILPLPLQGADLVVASGHKWLGGPPGTGFLWLSLRASQELPELYPAGEPLDPEAPLPHFEPTGGQDFAAWVGLQTALEEYQSAAPDELLLRAGMMAEDLRRQLAETFRRHQVGFQYLHPRLPDGSPSPVVVVSFVERDPYPLYTALARHHIHIKCIKTQLKDGTVLNLLRIGVPPHETAVHLHRVV